MSGNVWSIGGTTESAALAGAIATKFSPDERRRYIITVATPEARSLYLPEFKVISRRMNAAAMEDFCRKYRIAVIVDASHPYAVEVSQGAIATAKKLNLPYLRYERRAIALKESGSSLVTRLDSFATLVEGQYLQNHRVLLTVGCKVLPLFKSWHDRATLFARILPKPASLNIALASGFKGDRLICLRPPINLALEAALWRQWQISLVVTKASGVAGGEEIKTKLAAKFNVPLIIISRPRVVYPRQTDCLEEVIDFCREYL